MRIGVDVGTSVTKAVAFDDTGSARKVLSQRTELRRPAPGRYEYEIDQVAVSVRSMLAQLATADVELVALTGQGDGLCLVGDGGRPVSPAVSWLDGRAVEVCRSWMVDGVVDKVFSLTGNAPFPGSGAAILAALDGAAPDLLDSVRTATQCQAALFEQLTGVRVTTRSCAMLPVFDPARGDYSMDALELCGLSKRRDLLAPVAEPPVAVASMRDSVADQLGLPRGTPVSTGPYDLPAAALGAGLRCFGDGLLILGTTLACEVLSERVPAGGDSVGLTLSTGDGQGYLRAMPAMVGTSCLDWVLGLVGGRHSDLGRFLSRSTPGANGVRALPYLSTAGERAPFIEFSANAELIGLNLETTADDVVLALCESLAYAARHCLEAAGLTGDVIVCGGGTGSRELVQLFADVLGRPVRLARGELSARGAVAAAIPAMCGPHSPTPPEVVRPNEHVAYEDGYSGYLEHLAHARRRWRQRRERGSV